MKKTLSLALLILMIIFVFGCDSNPEVNSEEARNFSDDYTLEDLSTPFKDFEGDENVIITFAWNESRTQYLSITFFFSDISKETLNGGDYHVLSNQDFHSGTPTDYDAHVYFHTNDSSDIYMFSESGTIIIDDSIETLTLDNVEFEILERNESDTLEKIGTRIYNGIFHFME